jgi:hypothetical protein
MSYEEDIFAVCNCVFRRINECPDEKSGNTIRHFLYSLSKLDKNK